MLAPRILNRLSKLPFVRDVVSDKWRLRNLYLITMGKKLDLDNPQTFNEKLQWLKIYNRNPLYTTLVDKYRVKEYVAKKIGEQYVVPLLGVWDRFEDIDFSKLPDQFVLKCNHGNGDTVVCKDKKSFNIKQARVKLSRSLRRNYFYISGEWPYKNVPRKIIAEKYLVDELSNYEGLVDYKFFCFNGTVDCVMLCLDRCIEEVKYLYFDKDWNAVQVERNVPIIQKKSVFQKPRRLNEMIAIAERLSFGIPFVRIDLFENNDGVFFGETTFYPLGGFDSGYLPEIDLRFGKLLDLKSIC